MYISLIFDWMLALDSLVYQQIIVFYLQSHFLITASATVGSVFVEDCEDQCRSQGFGNLCSPVLLLYLKSAFSRLLYHPHQPQGTYVVSHFLLLEYYHNFLFCKVIDSCLLSFWWVQDPLLRFLIWFKILIIFHVMIISTFV